MSAEDHDGHHDDCKGHEDQSHGIGKHGHSLADQSHEGHGHSHKDHSHGDEGQEGGHCHEGHGHSHKDHSHGDDGQECGHCHEGHGHSHKDHSHGDDGQEGGHCHEVHGNGEEDHDHGSKLMDAKAYSEYWKDDDVIIKEPHECLIKYQDNILGDGMERLKILVPLCGRVFEMKYFADLGHEVVGVEFAEIAIQQFFEIFDISYETKPIDEPAGIVYTSTDDKLNIRIYCCDVFSFGPQLEKDFQAVWDSGAMHSLQKDQMMDYVTVMKSVQGPTCKSLVEFTYPSCGGYLSSAELLSMYGEDFTVKELGYTKTTSKYYLEFEIEGFYMFLVSPK